MMIVFVVLFVALLLWFVSSRAKIKGKIGEKRVAVLLSLLGKEYTVYNDVMIRNGSYTSQIDHVVVSPYGIFVIETKNYKGLIYGGLNQEKWTQNIWGNKTYLVNPIRQNYGHIIALKKILPSFSMDQYVSVVVFSTSANLRSNFPANYNVIYTPQLINRIKSYKERILTDDNILKIRATLEANLVRDRKAKKQHVVNVQRNLQIKRETVNSGRCPRCGGFLVKRNGKYGSFYGCSNYPRCKYTIG